MAPNPEILLGAVAVAAESRLGRAISGATEEIASGIWQRPASASLSLTELTNTPNGSLRDAIAGYKSGVPDTLNGALHPDGIGSALTDTRVRALGIKISEASKGWGGISHVILNAREKGRVILPPVEITNESPGLQSLGSWSNGRVKLGEDAFLSSQNPQQVGTTLHEITHHDQGYVVLARKAEQMGITKGAGSVDALIGVIKEDTAGGFAFTKGIAADFLVFKGQNRLSATASDRADQLIDSASKLFGRPAEEYGSAVSSRIGNIDYYLGMLENPAKAEEAKRFFLDLQDYKDAPSISKLIFPSSSREAQQAILVRELPMGSAEKWNASNFERARTVTENYLNDARISQSRIQRAWNRDYIDSLHEREARFNQHIATETVKSHLKDYFMTPEAGETRYWHPAGINL